MIYRRIFDQIPALVIGGRARVGQHDRNGFSQIHRAPAADSYDRVRLAVRKRFHAFREFVDVLGLGLCANIHEDDQIVRAERQFMDEGAFFVDCIDEKHDGRSCVRPLLGQDVAKLVDAASPENQLGDQTQVSIHRHVLGLFQH